MLAIVPFNGPPGVKQAEVMIGRALRKKATLVPQEKWLKSARKLFAPSHKAEDIADVAADVGAQVVITGIIRRDGRRWELTVSLRDGKTGKTRDRLKYPLKGPRLTDDVITILTKEVNDAFDSMLSPELADVKPAHPPAEKPPTTESHPATAQKAPEAAQSTPLPPVKELEDSPPPAPPPPPPVHAEVATAAPVRRPSWAPYFDLSVGPTISGRSFDFDPASQPKFASGVVAGIRADFTLPPLAGTWKRAGGAFAGLGLGASVDKPFWPDSTSKQDAMKYGTSELRVEGGLRWRIVLYKPVPRPQLLIQAGGGLHSLAIGKDAMGADVGPADVSYKYATFGAGLRVHFAERAWIWAMFDYHVVFDPGPIADLVAEYGPARTFGIRVRGGLDFLV
ncbi:MAG TPA: hypothetical protein VF334_03070, partial [Polyangia bacterium]